MKRRMKKQKNESRIVFFGTPQFAVSVLEEMDETGIMPDTIVTAPDKKAGRGLEVAPPEVKRWAEEKGVLTIQPEKLDANDPRAEILFNNEWDLFIVAAYGKILSREILKLPKYGTLNVHPSLLPKFRGPSPIESAILADEKETGVTIMLVDEELDHGKVVAQASITLERWPVRAPILEELLAHEGGKLLSEVIPQWLLGTIVPEPQNESKATFSKKIKKEMGLIDLAADAYQNYLKFCAYDGWPGTYFFAARAGKKIRIKITDAKYAEGAFTPTRVIPEGKHEMKYEDFARNLF